MNYSAQLEYFKGGRKLAGMLALILIAVTGACMAIGVTLPRSSLIASILIVLAICISLGYTPDYLHLTVNTQKRLRWQVKIRWRVAGLALILGLVLVPRGIGDIAIIVVTIWLVGNNLLLRESAPNHLLARYFWATDFVLLAVLLLLNQIPLSIGAILLAAVAHLAVVTCGDRPFRRASLVAASAGVLVLLAGLQQRLAWGSILADIAVVFVAARATAWLVQRAQYQNRMNSEQALGELKEFTGYSEERIWELWTTSNQQLAKNWQLAAPDEKNREQLAQWYRDNSELYMFAISAYNLEYKRIISNLRMLRFGQGSCLDYGAGNGELILELARRGRRAVYYDVEGTTLKFAQQRAKLRNLSVEFLHTKDDLARTVGQHGFDSIFSFDVLEHLPDLPGELTFLSSLLNPGGLLIFDVPAGATKSHPMHLNHHLDIHAHMSNHGLIEERPSWMPRLPFTKQEKYLFRAPATAKARVQPKLEAFIRDNTNSGSEIRN